jgi:hypothetical protein
MHFRWTWDTLIHDDGKAQEKNMRRSSEQQKYFSTLDRVFGDRMIWGELRHAISWDRRREKITPLLNDRQLTRRQANEALDDYSTCRTSRAPEYISCHIIFKA